MQVQGEKMHSEAMIGCGGAGGTSPCGTGGRPPCNNHWRRRERHTRRWCVLGFILIPVVLSLLWVQFASARETGQLLYADRYCGCRAMVENWVSDYVWTQMIWLPCNTLFLLIWVALGVKLWNGKRHPR
jgi:hypothetical protein